MTNTMQCFNRFAATFNALQHEGYSVPETVAGMHVGMAAFLCEAYAQGRSSLPSWDALLERETENFRAALARSIQQRIEEGES